MFRIYQLNIEISSIFQKYVGFNYHSPKFIINNVNQNGTFKYILWIFSTLKSLFHENVCHNLTDSSCTGPQLVCSEILFDINHFYHLILQSHRVKYISKVAISNLIRKRFEKDYQNCPDLEKGDLCPFNISKGSNDQEVVEEKTEILLIRYNYLAQLFELDKKNFHQECKSTLVYERDLNSNQVKLSRISERRDSRSKLYSSPVHCTLNTTVHVHCTRPASNCLLRQLLNKQLGRDLPQL